MSGGTTPSKPLSPLNPLSPLRLFATFCVLAPTVAVIAVPTYDSATPRLGGFPFFYWYQLLWVVLTGLLMVAAYWAIKVDGQRRRAHRAAAAGAAGAADSADPPGDGAAATDGEATE